jgi:hypothetical protein
MTLEVITNSGYSNHILSTGHAYRTITDTMEIVTTGRKGKYLNTLERYHIYEISKENLHMKDTHIDTILYSEHCTKFTQNNSTHLSAPAFLLPSTSLHYKYMLCQLVSLCPSL